MTATLPAPAYAALKGADVETYHFDTVHGAALVVRAGDGWRVSLGHWRRLIPDVLPADVAVQRAREATVCPVCGPKGSTGRECTTCFIAADHDFTRRQDR